MGQRHDMTFLQMFLRSGRSEGEQHGFDGRFKWCRKEQSLKLVRLVQVEILRRSMPVAVLAQVFDCSDILRLVWRLRDMWLMLAECGGGRQAGIIEVCCAWEIGRFMELKRWLVYEASRCEVVGKCGRDRSVHWFAGEI